MSPNLKCTELESELELSTVSLPDVLIQNEMSTSSYHAHESICHSEKN
jgi:hypothetical protein